MNTSSRVNRSLPLHLLILLPFAALVLSACDSYMRCPGGNCPSDEEILLKEGGVRLTPDQVRQRNVGYTEEWLRGGAYYREDGTMRAKWNKIYYDGTWEIKSDGSVCYELPRWQSRCHFYMDVDGDIFLLDEGRSIGLSYTFEGDVLRNMGSRKQHFDSRTP